MKNRIIYGRIHTDLKLHGTVTGRLSSSLHNIPKKADKERAREVRNIFIADEDHYLVEVDLKQAEFRIWGNYSQDPTMLKHLNDCNFDIHSNIASIGFRIPLEEVDSVKHRDPAKGVLFGKMYGRSDKSVMKQLGVEEDIIKQINSAIFDMYPVATQWINDTIRAAKRNKIIRNLFGRVRHLQGIIDSSNQNVRADGERYAVNSPIQSAASDLNNIIAYSCQKTFNKEKIKSHVILLIHDAIIFSIHKDYLDRSIEIIKNIVRHPTDEINVRLDIDIDIGSKFGEMVPLAEFHNKQKKRV